MTGLPYFADDTVTLHHGDALAVLAGMPDGSVDCIVTSPPYLGLREYGVTGTDWPAMSYAPMHGLPHVDVPAMTCPLGLEPTPAAFVAHLVLIFREARRVLADDGTLWLNLGDSYAAGSRSSYASTGKAAGRVGASRPASSLPGKNLLGIPWRAAYALQADGWIIRNDNIWAKPNGMPESVRDRLTAKHEHIFLFAKSPRYYFNLDAIREPLKYPDAADGTRVFGGKNKAGVGVVGSSERRHGATYGKASGTNLAPTGRQHLTGERAQKRRARELFKEAGLTEEHLAAMRAVGMSDAGKARETQGGSGRNTASVQRLADEAKAALGGYCREFLYEDGRNPGDVWTIPTVPFSGAHFAVFPPTLAEKCILAGCKPGGTVLDPFSGSGTTGMVAARHGLRYVGIDASRDFLDLSLRTRLRQGALIEGDTP
jgi:DNA modification methylase